MPRKTGLCSGIPSGFGKADSPLCFMIMLSLPRPRLIRVFTHLIGALVAPLLGTSAAALPSAIPRQGPSLPDDVFLQETGRQVPSPVPLTAVALDNGDIFAGTAQGLLRLRGENWAEVPALRDPIQRLIAAGGHLWAMTPAGLYRRDADSWKRIAGEPVTALGGHRGEVVTATSRRLWRVRGDSLEPLTQAESPFAISGLVSHCESLYLLGAGRLTVFGQGGFGGRDVYDFPSDQTWDWGDLPSPNTRDLLSLGSRLIVATDRGLGVLRGMTMTTLRGEQGLPFEDTTSLAAGFTNDLWIGTSRGAIRNVNGAYHYFAGRRWLPDDHVRAVAVSDRAVYLATDRGLGIIEYEPFTLLKKAAYYEQHLEAWGQKRLGFVHKLEWDGPLREFVREVSDNDGGYSGNYLAAQAYRFAVTKSPEARREATHTFHALRWLEGMTAIPGFPARSVWVKNERGHKAMGGSGGFPAEWHDTADGRFEWKGDTSSDELCSHFYAIVRFLELAAEGDEIAQGKIHLARLATHLIEHDWQLIDLDGKPTRWGRWDPDYFRTDEGRFDRGLQAVEILSFMKTAEHLTGDARFTEAYRRLVDLGYPKFTLRQRSTFPLEDIAHFEDELAFWSWWNLLRFEQDSERRALYRRGFERSYEIVRIEQNPWFNFVYGTLTGHECEPAAALAHLREWPLDLVVWSFQNSHRADLRTPLGYMALKGGTRPFSPREREPMRWDAWTMKADGGTGGTDVVEPSAWLLAYWMGRYHGFIAAPTATDAAVLTIDPNRIPKRGAKPYDGPPRPHGF